MIIKIFRPKFGLVLFFMILGFILPGCASRKIPVEPIKTKASKQLGLLQDSHTRGTKIWKKKKLSTPQIEGMVFTKGGCFYMGDAFGDGDRDEKPVHEVCVYDFYMGKHEVTQREWNAIMGNNPSYFQECGNTCPVEKVSWNDVQEFIRKLNIKTGINYRLPTEAEWEYAAREGGKKIKFNGLLNESDLSTYANFCDINCETGWKAKNQDDGYKNTAPVKTYKPNSLGLYDMSGNVWEWVSDLYGHSYYSNSPRNNPKGPAGGTLRVFRGGGWLDESRGLRASNRASVEPDGSYGLLGFRLAITP